MLYPSDPDPSEAHVLTLESYKAPEWSPEWSPRVEWSPDWAQSGSQSRAYPDPEWSLKLSFLDGMSRSEAAVTLGFLWASVQYPDVVADLLGGPGGPFADDSPMEDQPSAPGGVSSETPTSRIAVAGEMPVAAELERFLGLLRQLPGPWREELLQVIRNRKAARKATLRILRNRRAHWTPVHRPAPVPAVLASQRIRIRLASHPTHAP